MSHDGRFVWFDLMTTDLDAALAFYKAVIGWEVTDSGMPGPSPYMLVHGSGQPVGGVTQLSDEMCSQGARTGWMGHIYVPSVDAAADKLAALGGAVLRAPNDIPGVGRFAVVADLHGAVFSLFTNAPEYPMRPTPPMGTPGHVGWSELHAGDGAAALDFYANLFGWSLNQEMDMGPMGVYRTYSPADGGDAVGGIMTKAADFPMAAWLFYFSVDAAGAAAERIKVAGGQVAMGPIEVPGGGWIAMAFDPQGGMFAVLSDKP